MVTGKLIKGGEGRGRKRKRIKMTKVCYVHVQISQYKQHYPVLQIHEGKNMYSTKIIFLNYTHIFPKDS